VVWASRARGPRLAQVCTSPIPNDKARPPLYLRHVIPPARCLAVSLRPLPALLVAALLPLAACGNGYSPDIYATRAVQQANKVEQGVIVGVRQINISAGGETGAAAGAAAGGVLGAQAPSGIFSALGGVGGAVIGGIAGSAAEHRFVDTVAHEYVVRVTGKNDLISVTQRDERPLAVGQKVLVIAGNQARIVPDYTVPTEAVAPSATPPAMPVRQPVQQPVPEPTRTEPVMPTMPAPVAAPPGFPGLPAPVLVPQPAPPLPSAPES
jgi:outer membrane lipoprotein SlyB